MQRLRVLHPITQLAVGGASENTITTCRYTDAERFESVILSGRIEATEDHLIDHAEVAGVPVRSLSSLRRPIRPHKDLPAFRDLRKFLRRERWDIIHTHGSKAGILGRLAAAQVSVPVIIHTAHGWGHHNHMGSGMRALIIALERRAARVTHKLIAVSQSTLERGLQDGIGRREQYVVIHSGIDLAAYRDVSADKRSVREKLCIPPDAPVIGTVSRLSAQKAPQDFLKVASLVHARCPQARFVYVGGGPLEPEFQAGIQSLGLQKVVHDLGYRYDVPELLRAFDVFLLTSLWEGLPRVFAQSMCASLPIVATRVDGAPEAVEHGQTGYLVEPRDCEGMARHIGELIGDPEKRQRMGSRGLERVHPLFCDRHMVKQIEEVYLECWQKQRGGAAKELAFQTS
jgi:glycosyltransferase involved in cell wall biosynthesis